MPIVTVICTGAMTATVTVITVSTSLGLAGVVGENDVILPQPLAPIGTVKGVVGFAILLHQQPYSEIPFVTYASYAMG